MMDCKLNKIVSINHVNPIEIKTHTHQNNEITYFVSGEGVVRSGDREYIYKENTFAFFKAGTKHSEFDPNPCNIIWLHFDFDIDGIDLKEGVFEDADKSLLMMLNKLKNSYYSQGVHSEKLTESLLSQTIITAAIKQVDTEHTRNQVDWQTVIEHIDNNIRNFIDFKELANQNGYSYDRFRHIFKERFGVSVYAYLTQRRIRLAKELLKRTNLSITEVGFECGFNSSSQFANIFKTHTGKTPKEYKAEKEETK